MEHDFGVCSLQTLQGMTTHQYPLSTTEDTTFQFKIIFKGLEFCVHCTFKPFRRKNFTFHDFQIQSLIPPGASAEAVSQSKGPIAEVSQRLYERFFKEKAGYCFTFSRDDVKLSRPNKRQAGSDCSRSKRRKSTWTSLTSIQDVQNDYRKAQQSGKLKSSFLPRLETTPLESPSSCSIRRWDPYIWYTTGQGTRSDLLHNALLNDKKLDKRLQQIKKLCKEVPKATEWTTHVLEKSLTPADLCKIIETAVAPLTNLADVGSPVSCSDEMPHILTMALSAFSQADKLESKQAIAVAKLVGSALLRVSDGVEGHCRLNKYFKPRQIRSRNFASWLCWLMARLSGWKGREMQLYLMLVESGEETLQELYSPYDPSAVGELFTRLNSEIYSKDVLNSPHIPNVVEIVKDVLDGYVDGISICRLLGCPDSYLGPVQAPVFEFLEPETVLSIRSRTAQRSSDHNGACLDITSASTADQSEVVGDQSQPGCELSQITPGDEQEHQVQIVHAGSATTAPDTWGVPLQTGISAATRLDTHDSTANEGDMCGNPQDYFDLDCEPNWDLAWPPLGDDMYASLDELDSYTYNGSTM